MRRILNVDDTEALRYAKTRALQKAGLPLSKQARAKTRSTLSSVKIRTSCCWT